MVKRTPFHERLAPFNKPEIWEHWKGYLSATKYDHSELVEYYATRNAVAVLDTSPLFKYEIAGPDAEALLMKVLIRDISTCNPGHSQYTAWCNDAGFVLEDGVILRVEEDRYLLTSAEPNLRHFANSAGDLDVSVTDVSADYGILAIQGPHSLSVLDQLSDDIKPLPYFGVTTTRVADADVIVSRTGFTGDLGYEVWIPSGAATEVFDAIWAAGQNYNIVPLGLTALSMARIEAGLLLIGVDFHSARHAWTDAQRETPIELGWSWMVKNLASDDRHFIGRAAIESELTNKTSRWNTVGIAVDWKDLDRLHRDVGVLTPKEGLLNESTMSIYRRRDTPWEYAGYASSFAWSSIRQQHVGIAKLPIDLSSAGSEVELEVSIIRRPVNVLARVVPMPFFNPSRKTASHLS